MKIMGKKNKKKFVRVVLEIYKKALIKVQINSIYYRFYVKLHFHKFQSTANYW